MPFLRQSVTFLNHQKGHRMTLDLKAITGIACDMDGVLWLGDEPLPGLADFFELLRERSLPYVLATNNSTKTPMDYVGKLARMGIADVTVEHIVTSSTVTLEYLHAHFPAGTTINMVGESGLRRLLEEGGYRLVERDAEVVVVGLDTGLTYEKLKNAAFCIRKGAAFIATNDDPSLPTPDGLAPGAGSIVAAVRTATDHDPVIIGKPHRPMFQAALQRLGTAPAQTLMIGDRLTTDIAGAIEAGWRSALVLTGVTDDERLDDSTIFPDGVFPDLAHLVESWQQV